jgi:hypothetical protein
MSKCGQSCALTKHALRHLPLPSYIEMSSQGVIAATLASSYSLSSEARVRDLPISDNSPYSKRARSDVTSNYRGRGSGAHEWRGGSRTFFYTTAYHFY